VVLCQNRKDLERVNDVRTSRPDQETRDIAAPEMPTTSTPLTDLENAVASRGIQE